MSMTTNDTDARLTRLERMLRALGVDPEQVPEPASRPAPPETPEQAAARLGIGAGELRTIAQSLGAHPRELEAVEQTKDGLVAQLRGDHARVILRPADQPDGHGRTGWLRLPHPNPATEAQREKHGAPAFVRPGGRAA